MHLSSRSNQFHGIAPVFLATQPAPTAASTAQDDGLWQFLQYMWESCESLGWQRIGTPLLLAVAMALVILWPCARLITRGKGSLVSTILFGGSMIALSTAFFALAYFVARAESLPLLCALGVVYLAILYAQTRHLYSASRPAAAGILGCFLVLIAGGLYGAEQLTGRTPWTEFFSKSKEDQGRAIAAWQTGRKAPATAATAVVATPTTPPSTAANTAANPTTAVAPAPVPTAPPPAPARSGPDLQALFAQLQKARATLDTNDPVAVARFNEQAAAYHQEKALATPVAAPKAQPVKAKPDLVER